MHLVVIADAYPPMKTSGAVQLRDLVAELCQQGNEVTLILPDATLDRPWRIEQKENLEIIRLLSLATKDVSYFRRAIGEHLLSFTMYLNFRKSPLADKHWQGIIWYSPSIFFGTLVEKLKQESGCRTYLILRDIFPEWAVDMGLLGRGMIYRYFKRKEKLQYRQADVIGVQTSSNMNYLASQYSDLPARVEVLSNWLAPALARECGIRLEETGLAGRRIFVYTGNIGIAQGMDILIDLAEAFQGDSSVGFLFVGRGTAAGRIRKLAFDKSLNNILFFDEIPPEEIPALLAQCHIGLIALDPRHTNDNIPGKFLAYMQAGLPVLATINPGNDLEVLINESRVGKVVTDNALASLKLKADELLAEFGGDPELPVRCRELAATRFSPAAAARQIVEALSDV